MRGTTCGVRNSNIPIRMKLSRELLESIIAPSNLLEKEAVVPLWRIILELLLELKTNKNFA